MLEGEIRKLLGKLGIEGRRANSDGWIPARCPFAMYGFHGDTVDTNPSFFIKIDGIKPSGFHCFTCGFHGNLASLVSKLEHHGGVDYGNLSTQIMLSEMQTHFAEFGVPAEEYEAPTELPEEAYKGMYPSVALHSEAMLYLRGRGVSSDTAETLGLLWHDTEKRILFPVRDYEGKLYGFTGRATVRTEENAAKKVKDYAGLKKRWLLLGENLVEEGDQFHEETLPILVVEGLFALAHMIEIGAGEVCNPVATMGSSLSDEQRDRLIELDRPVYFLYDDDAAGDKGLYGADNTVGALDKLREHTPTYECFYPEDSTGDPDDLTLEDVKWILSKGSELKSVDKGRKF